jgi:hypothetical protein
MSTEAQIIANRHNAQKSTGPNSRKGKAIASKNALKHGLLARKDVIGSENRGEFCLYRDWMIDELAPAGPMESMLAERIVSLSWRLKRAGLIQKLTIDAMNEDNANSPLTKLTKSLLQKQQNQSKTKTSTPAVDLTLGRLAIKDFSNARVLERLLMYEQRIENSLYKTILELQKLQLMRNLDTESDIPLKGSSNNCF